MRVGRHGTAERQLIGPGLFLGQAPAREAIGKRLALEVEIACDQRRPADSGLGCDETLLVVHLQHTTQTGQIEQDAAFEELLRAHRMARAAQRDRLADLRSGGDVAAQLLHGRRREDPLHPGRIELRMDVVDLHGRQGKLQPAVASTKRTLSHSDEVAFRLSAICHAAREIRRAATTAHAIMHEAACQSG